MSREGPWGPELSKGQGSFIAADCISQQDAGIIYPATGVCHQIANRILSPARITVQGAGGYAESVNIYGKYGPGVPGFPDTFFLVRYRRCMQSGTHPQGTMLSIRPDFDRFPNELRVSMADRTSQPDDTETRLAELTELVVSGLGDKLDGETFCKLAEIQHATREEQRALSAGLMAGSIDRQTYIARFAEIARKMNNRNEAVLGRDRFREIFGDPEVAEHLIDQEESF